LRFDGGSHAARLFDDVAVAQPQDLKAERGEAAVPGQIVGSGDGAAVVAAAVRLDDQPLGSPEEVDPVTVDAHPLRYAARDAVLAHPTVRSWADVITPCRRAAISATAMSTSLSCT
jgi:hypothetical protein